MKHKCTFPWFFSFLFFLSILTFPFDKSDLPSNRSKRSTRSISSLQREVKRLAVGCTKCLWPAQKHWMDWVTPTRTYTRFYLGFKPGHILLLLLLIPALLAPLKPKSGLFAQIPRSPSGLLKHRELQSSFTAAQLGGFPSMCPS